VSGHTGGPGSGNPPAPGDGDAAWSWWFQKNAGAQIDSHRLQTISANQEKALINSGWKN
jgi:hypothetical protein